MKISPSLATRRIPLSAALVYLASVGLLLSLLMGCGQKGPLTRGERSVDLSKTPASEPGAASSQPGSGSPPR